MGTSYMGFVQWAIAAEAGPALQAMAPQVTSSEFRSAAYPGESFWLDTAINWISLMNDKENPLRAILSVQLGLTKKLRPAFTQLPLSS